MSPVVRAATWAGLGALMLPLDALHVVTGAITYRSPDLGLQAFWAVPLFMGAGLGMGFGHRFIATPLTRRFCGHPADGMPRSTSWGAAAGLVALVTVYAASGPLRAHPEAALALFIAMWAAIVWRVHPDARATLLVHSLSTAIIGPLVEIGISSTGAFSHASHELFGVALWLPGIYLNAAAASHLLDRRLG